MSKKVKLGLIAGAVLAALAGAGAAIATATGGDDGSGQPITGGALDRASAVAIAHAGGGRVTGNELQDEEGYYEIEVTRSDGTQVDVHLDRNFKVIDSSADGGGSADSESSGD